MQPIRSAGAVANTLAGAREAPPLSAEQLRQLQTREFSVPKDAAFAATMTVLLDLGYRVQSADIETGLIVASASSVDRLQLDLRGIGTARQTPMASVYVEVRGPLSTRVRVNLTVGTSGTIGGVGERSVREEGPYEIFFAHLEREITDRQRALHAAPASVRQAVSDQVDATASEPRAPDVGSESGEEESVSEPAVATASEEPGGLDESSSDALENGSSTE